VLAAFFHFFARKFCLCSSTADDHRDQFHCLHALVGRSAILWTFLYFTKKKIEACRDLWSSGHAVQESEQAREREREFCLFCRCFGEGGSEEEAERREEM
jgi:hypothetical protein